jgi:hypothetical protein
MEESRRGVIEGNVSEFEWNDWGIPRENEAE